MGLGRRFCLATSAACLMGVASAAYSGPDEVTDRLMDESASLFDVGMLRLELRLAEAESIPATSTYYDWEKNQIVIWSVVFESGWTLERATAACDGWFRQIRMLAAVNPDTGVLYPMYKRSSFAEMFSHNGFVRTINGKDTSEVAAQLDDKFSLSFSWQRTDAPVGEVSSLTCSGALTEQGYSTKTTKAE